MKSYTTDVVFNQATITITSDAELLVGPVDSESYIIVDQIGMSIPLLWRKVPWWRRLLRMFR
jgi:hypothetical protein